MHKFHFIFVPIFKNMRCSCSVTDVSHCYGGNSSAGNSAEARTTTLALHRSSEKLLGDRFLAFLAGESTTLPNNNQVVPRNSRRVSSSLPSAGAGFVPRCAIWFALYEESCPESVVFAGSSYFLGVTRKSFHSSFLPSFSATP